MSRSRSDRQGRGGRCPEGRQCDWCGPKAAADRRDARAATVAEGVAEHELEPPYRSCDDDCPECGSQEERIEDGVLAALLMDEEL